MGAVEALTLRVSALESLLEGRAQHLRSAFFSKYFGVDLMPSFRQARALGVFWEGTDRGTEGRVSHLRPDMGDGDRRLCMAGRLLLSLIRHPCRLPP